MRHPYFITWGFARLIVLFVLLAFYEIFGRYFTDLLNRKEYKQDSRFWCFSYIYIYTDLLFNLSSLKINRGDAILMTCNPYAFFLHFLCTSDAILMYVTCTFYASLMHGVCTFWHFFCNPYAFFMHFWCNSYAFLMLFCIFNALFLHMLCTSDALFMHFLCTLWKCIKSA